MFKAMHLSWKRPYLMQEGRLLERGKLLNLFLEQRYSKVGRSDYVDEGYVYVSAIDVLCVLSWPSYFKSRSLQFEN